MIKPGSRWKSAVCEAEVVVVRLPSRAGLPQCGGVDMVPLDQHTVTVAIISGFDSGCAVGKRYRAADSGIELLCTKAGRGTLGFDGSTLVPVEAKQLPSSD
jgi:hypothetical protein